MLERATSFQGGQEEFAQQGWCQRKGVGRDRAASFRVEPGPGSLEQSDESGPQVASVWKGLLVGRHATEQRGAGAERTTWPRGLDFQRGVLLGAVISCPILGKRVSSV